MLTGILTCSLLVISVYSSLESVFNVAELGAYRSHISIQSQVQTDLNILNKQNTTEFSYVLNKNSFPMFNTVTGFDLVAYLKEKLYEEEPEAFKQDESLIDAAIIEYHKYLELTKNWVNTDKNNKYIYIPSKLIDFVWHWHILQTYEYHLMCNKQFNGIFLHHRPYYGKEKKSKVFNGRINKYVKTLEHYTSYFGYYPPVSIWGKYKHSIADCQMHQCNSKMLADCDEMHICNSLMDAECSQMHGCNSKMIGNCDEMHACDSFMDAECSQMHGCNSKMIADCQMHGCDSIMDRINVI